MIQYPKITLTGIVSNVNMTSANSSGTFWIYNFNSSLINNSTIITIVATDTGGNFYSDPNNSFTIDKDISNCRRF